MSHWHMSAAEFSSYETEVFYADLLLNRRKKSGLNVRFTRLDDFYDRANAFCIGLAVLAIVRHANMSTELGRSIGRPDVPPSTWNNP
jgi:hypothetical protein